MIKTKIKPDLLALLTSGKFDAFTCPALTQAYVSLPTCTSPNKRAASQIVGRAVKSLKAEGLIETRPGGYSEGNAKSPQYLLTEDFYRLFTCAPSTSDQPSSVAGDSDFIEELNEKLHDYKIELLEAIGEVEEYEVISKAAPEKMPQIQVLYCRARDHFSKTQGRVRAIETMLSQIGHS